MIFTQFCQLYETVVLQQTLIEFNSVHRNKTKTNYTWLNLVFDVFKSINISKKLLFSILLDNQIKNILIMKNPVDF